MRFLLFILLIIVSGCGLLDKPNNYEELTKVFTESLIDGNYEYCLELFSWDHEVSINLDRDTIRKDLPEVRDIIINNFGNELNYQFLSWEKSFSTIEGKANPEATTVVLIQITNQQQFGILKLLIDDNSNKILYFSPLQIRENIPNTLLFWLFGTIALIVLIFNIYVLLKLRKSNLKRKWLKYIAVFLINTPVITYSAVYGIGFKQSLFQGLFGIGLNLGGYASMIWSIGVPIGGIYWLWKLNDKNESQ